MVNLFYFCRFKNYIEKEDRVTLEHLAEDLTQLLGQFDYMFRLEGSEEEVESAEVAIKRSYSVDIIEIYPVLEGGFGNESTNSI